MKRQLKGYYRDINKQLLCSKSEKKRVLGQLKESVSCFLQENPEADMSAVYENFGTAEEIVEANINNMSDRYILKQMKTKRIIIFGVVSAFALILLIYFSLLFYTEFRSREFLSNTERYTEKYGHHTTGYGIFDDKPVIYAPPKESMQEEEQP